MKKNKKRNDSMRREYDFSGGERGKFFHVPESQRMIPLDADIIRHFQRRGRKEKKAYYVLINETLRRTMDSEKPAASIAGLLQEMIAKEVQKHAVRK
jgi:uncharacterized protein (DUF4415 family)